MAERAALVVARVHLESKRLVRSLTDIVITQSQEEDNERLERMVELGAMPRTLMARGGEWRAVGGLRRGLSVMYQPEEELEDTDVEAEDGVEDIEEETDPSAGRDMGPRPLSVALRQTRKRGIEINDIHLTKASQERYEGAN